MYKSLYCLALSLLVVICPVNIGAEVFSPEVCEDMMILESIASEPTYRMRSLGVYKLSAYCKQNYHHICNDGDSSTTATGTVPTAGRTIAVDPRVIPYGSKVVINGHTYIAEDCGGAIKGKRIDIVFNTHKEALAFGIQYAEVFIVEEDK